MKMVKVTWNRQELLLNPACIIAVHAAGAHTMIDTVSSGTGTTRWTVSEPPEEVAKRFEEATA